MQFEIAAAVLILLLLSFLAVVDMAFSQLSDVGLRRLSSDFEGSTKIKSVEFLQEIMENRPRFRFALSAAIQIFLISFTVLVTLIIWQIGQPHYQWLAFSILVALVATIIFRQLLPRLLTRQNPEAKLILLLPVIRPFYGLLTLIADPFQFFTREESPVENTVVPNPTVEEVREDNAEDKQALIEMGEAEGILEEKDRELLETMFEFNETKAGEIMTPRTEIVAVSIDATVKSVRDLIIEEKVSRLPVYRESIDNIEGVIYVRDLLNIWSEDSAMETIEQILRPAFFIPETKSAAELLKTMQLNRVQIAIVVDEYGGVAGLITVEDIVEEIVGEIEDEDEKEEITEIIEGEDKSYNDVLGSTEIGKVERIFDMEIEDDDFSTLAGLVTSEAGYVPKVGEKLTIRGLDIEILQADEKKVTLLRLKKVKLDAESTAVLSE